jgi:hypothetical protein
LFKRISNKKIKLNIIDFSEPQDLKKNQASKKSENKRMNYEHFMSDNNVKCSDSC